MKTEFSLELFYEQDDDLGFAEAEAQKLCALVSCLAPHIELRTKVYKATSISTCPLKRKDGRVYDIPTHEPMEEGSQTLVVTNNGIGSQGRAGPGKGCVCKPKMEQKIRNGGDSAEITIHEWLHTIAGETINGRTIPDPDCKEGYRFRKEGPDGEPQWLEWFRYMLRAE
jgi:hypothetical protein